MLWENIGEAADFLGRKVLEYLGSSGEIKLMTQDMLLEAEIHIPFSAHPTCLNELTSLDDVICYRLVAFADSSAKAALLTIFFGAFRPVPLNGFWAEIDPAEAPPDQHQWLSCVSMVHTPDEAFHFLRYFVGDLGAFIKLKSRADGFPILTVEQLNPPQTAPTCQ